mgnify:CR=1 FL=1
MSSRLSKTEADIDLATLSIQGDLLEEMYREETDVDEISIESNPVLVLEDFVDEAIIDDAESTTNGLHTFELEITEAESRDAEIPNTFSAYEQKLATAAQLVGKGLEEEAILVYMEILDEDPTCFQAHFNLGSLYDDLGYHGLAIGCFIMADELDSNNPQVLASLGAAYGAVSRFEDADAELQRARELNPDSLEVLAKEGLLAFRKGLYADAEEGLREVCKNDPDNVSAHFYRGESLNRLGRVEEALMVMRHVIERQPNNWRAYHTLGMLFDKKHDPKRAAEMYRRAQDLNVL